MLIRQLQDQCKAIAGVRKVRLQLQRSAIGLDRRCEVAKRVLDTGQAVMREGKFWVELDGFLQGRRSLAPILFGHQCDAELKMGFGVVRLERDRRATFIDGRIEIADTIESLSQLEPAVGPVRGQPDCIAQRTQCCHGVLSFMRQEFREAVFIRRYWSRRGFGRRRLGLNHRGRHVLKRLRERRIGGGTSDTGCEQEGHEHQSATHWKPATPLEVSEENHYSIEHVWSGRSGQ